MRIFVFLFSFALPFLAGDAYAAEELSKLDVASVRIGMTADRATEALAKHFNVPKSKVKTVETKLRSGAKDMSVVFDDGKTKCEAGLGEDPATHKLVVTSVMYTIPDTPENRESMKTAATQKYGEVSLSAGGNGYDVRWCANPANAADSLCASEEMVLLRLTSSRISLFLNDVNRGQRAEDLHREADLKSKATKPRL
jgi:hypothetical protein